MNSPRNSWVLGVAVALATSSVTYAEGFYISGQVGVSEQANKSEPYGSNIAADADFPATFDAGDGTVGAVGVGYVFSDQFRIEGRMGYRDGSFSDQKFGTGARDGEEYILDGDIKSTTVTIEGFYDFPNNSPVTPYVKAGLGVSDNSYSARLGGAGVAPFDPFDGTVDGFYDNYADGDSTEFSWNAGLGANYAVTESTSIYGEYQYASFGDVNTGQDAFTDGFKIDDAAAHEFAIGIRFQF